MGALSSFPYLLSPSYYWHGASEQLSRHPASERPWLNRAFSALGNPLCREIIEMIVQAPGLSVNDVCDQYSVSRFAIMRHLNLLEEAELLYREREGKSKKLYIDQGNMMRLTKGWLAEMSRHSNDK